MFMSLSVHRTHDQTGKHFLAEKFRSGLAAVTISVVLGTITSVTNSDSV